MPLPSMFQRLVLLADSLGRNALPWLQSGALLAARLFLLDVFFKSGLTKLQDWDSTLFLFAEEYHVPLLPPELAAVLGTGGELVFPVVLAAGLLSRPAALGVFAINLVAAISYPGLNEAGIKDHILWGTLAAALVLFGPGKLSLDAWWWPKALRWARG